MFFARGLKCCGPLNLQRSLLRLSMSAFRSLRESPVANYIRGYWHLLKPPVRASQTMSLIDTISAYSIPKPQRLLHVGANRGHEANDYATHGIEAWHVEAIPETYQLLCRECSSYRNQHSVQACLSNIPGQQVSFNIASNSGLSSSMLRLGRHALAHPEIYYARSINLTTSTIASLIKAGTIPQNIGFLVIDAQGAELLTLQGAKGLLASGSLQGAIIETSVEPLCDGGASYIEISSELKSYSLYLCKAEFNHNGWCDALYGAKCWP